MTQKKSFYLNLNQYRNAHHFTLSKAKINFAAIVSPRVQHLPAFNQIRMLYTLFSPSNQLCDTANICCIVDKFFSDVLVSTRKLIDDNRTIVLEVAFVYGGVDKHDPRVEVMIVPEPSIPAI